MDYDQNNPGNASLAEPQGKAAYTWLSSTLSNTFKANKIVYADGHAAALDHVHPLSLVGLLDSAEKEQLGGFGGSGGYSQNGSTPGLKLKPLTMLSRRISRKCKLLLLKLLDRWYLALTPTNLENFFPVGRS